MTTGTFNAADVIAERELDYEVPGKTEQRRATLRIGRPAFSPTERGDESGRWTVPYELLFDDGQVYRQRAYGEDAVQALHLGMVLIQQTLRLRFRGKFTWLGLPDGGFPEVDLPPPSSAVPPL